MGLDQRRLHRLDLGQRHRRLAAGARRAVTDAELLVWARGVRKIARSIGTQCGLWDLIFDAEAHAHGQRALLPREVVEAMITEIRITDIDTRGTDAPRLDRKARKQTGGGL
jgi:hypothetical protein